jgi:Ca2+-binding EF-hand superfamily protein/Ni/Co efflux regulator RcnB
MKTWGLPVPKEATMKFSISICMTLVIAITVQALSAGSLNAQDRDRDRDDRKERDHERRLRDDIRNEQWRKKFDAAEYLKSQDKNNDGVLDPEEIDGRRTKKFLEQMGIPTGKKSKVEDLVKSYNSRISNEAAKKRKAFESRLNNLAQFGAEPETFGVGEFGTEDKTEGLQSFDESASGMKASDFEPEMLEKAEKLLGTFDRDDNGFLDGDEISRLSWRSPPPETSDLNRDGRLSKMELAKRFTAGEETSQRSRSSRERDDPFARSRGSSSEESSSSDSRSRRDYGSRDRDRGSRDGDRDSRRYEKRETPKPTSGSAVAKAKANAQSAAGYAKYVDRSFKKYDANSDGRLDKKELSASSLLKKAKDSNGDGFISKQEAITLVSGGKIKPPNAAAGSQKPKPKKPFKRPTTAVAAASSTGGRSSLSDKDVDADGQIQMHEYTDTWTVEKLKEFRDKDKNGDGLLSPAEWRGNNR